MLLLVALAVPTTQIIQHSTSAFHVHSNADEQTAQYSMQDQNQKLK